MDDPSRRALARVAALASEMDAITVARDATDLCERLRAGRWYVVCLGQFKRGKSTLLNALVGRAILPAGIVPITSVVTVLRHGEAVAARVRLTAGEWVACAIDALPAYLTETQNPGNVKGVTGAEIFVTSTLLESGLCLVDTPGVGSISVANTESARAFIPQIDAALVVLGVDPPIGADEVALVREAVAHTPVVLIALNKADRHSDTERRQVADFSRHVLTDVLGHAPRIYEVSALEALAGRHDRDWHALIRELRGGEDRSSKRLLETAARRGVVSLANRLLDEIEREQQALDRPITESEAQMAELDPLRDGTHEGLEELGHRLAGVESRLRRAFEAERDEFFDVARRECAREVRAYVLGDAVPSRERAYEAARRIAFRRLEAWGIDVGPRIERLYQDAVRRFVEFANRVQQDLEMNGVIAPDACGADPSFTTASGYRPAMMLHLTAANPFRWVLDRFRPASVRRPALAAEASRYVERLLEVNSARVTNDFIERVTTSRRTLEREVRDRLTDLALSIERAIARARAVRDTGLAAVAERRTWLEQRREELLALRAVGVSASRTG